MTSKSTAKPPTAKSTPKSTTKPPATKTSARTTAPGGSAKSCANAYEFADILVNGTDPASGTAPSSGDVQSYHLYADQCRSDASSGNAHDKACREGLQFADILISGKDPVSGGPPSSGDSQTYFADKQTCVGS